MKYHKNLSLKNLNTFYSIYIEIAILFLYVSIGLYLIFRVIKFIKISNKMVNFLFIK